VLSMACAENKGVILAPQVGLGSEYGIDRIGSHWFYCSASNTFGQKCLLCTSDLSHATAFQRPQLTGTPFARPVPVAAAFLASGYTTPQWLSPVVSF